MTAAYEKFMDQYRAIGSAKADGYSRDVFIGLEMDEQEEVFNLLVSELPNTVNWLFVLDPEKALPIVRNRVQMWRGDRGKHVFLLQEALIKYGGDMTYQAQMIDDYPGYIDYLRPQAVAAIGRTPTNGATITFFKQVILTETKSEAVFRAADELLSALGVQCSTAEEIQQYRCYLLNLCSENVQDKLGVLSELEKRYGTGFN